MKYVKMLMSYMVSFVAIVLAFMLGLPLRFSHLIVAMVADTFTYSAMGLRYLHVQLASKIVYPLLAKARKLAGK